jgi:hypothetical protein
MEKAPALAPVEVTALSSPLYKSLNEHQVTGAISTICQRRQNVKKQKGLSTFS